MVTMKSVDVYPFDFLYLGVHEAVIWPKRFEIGYLNPLIFSSLYQGSIGDYDNILGGLSLGLFLPPVFDVYGSFFFDEFRPNSFSDLFTHVRNLYSYQVGIRTTIPKLPFGSLTVQYSKIEPFTYTHPLTEVPWLKSEDSLQQSGYVNESFISVGKGISSKLDPNSDELLVQFEAFILKKSKILGSYQMIRHGEYGGSYDAPLDPGYIPSSGVNGILPEGMEYPVWLEGASVSDVQSVETIRKEFLHDGNYDWYHIFTLGLSFNLDSVVFIPVRVNIANSLVYSFTTDRDVQKIIDSENFTNYISIAISFWD